VDSGRFSLPELRAALQALTGSRVTDIGQSISMVQVGFDQAGTVHRLHIMCSMRVVRGEQILVGTTDMMFPDPDVAHDPPKTLFDRNAKMLTALLEDADFRVLGAEMADSGSFVLEVTDSVRFQVIPTCSGPFEAWRLFAKGDRDTHYVYPESSLYDDYPDYADSDWS
jgi:hypothetical protein